MDVRTAIGDGQSFKGFSTKRGWWPFLCSGIAEGEDGQGCMLYNTEGKTLYVNTRVNRLSLETPIWIRRHIEGRVHYKISTLKTIDEKTIEVRFDAFKSFAALRDERLRLGAIKGTSDLAVKLPANAVVTEALSAARMRRPPVQHKTPCICKKAGSK